jgi:hypothetical protein
VAGWSRPRAARTRAGSRPWPSGGPSDHRHRAQ